MVWQPTLGYIASMADTAISDRYQVLSTLGKGGMGVVLKCEDTLLKRVVAVKVLTTTTTGNAIKRFQREAKAAAKLKQANILQVLDFGETSEGRLYLVMDFVEGMTLDELLKERKYLPIEESIPLFQQICKGIAHAHGQGVLHRDIKPSNVMLANTEADWVKIVDFGIAKLNSEDQRLTSTGAIVGSPPYMAPEATVNQDVDARSDIYSIGCLMFETLTGSPPYDGETAMATVLMHTTEPIPSLSQRSDQELPPELEKIVTKCLAKNARDRYQNVNALLADLDKLETSLVDQVGVDEEQRAEQLRQEETRTVEDERRKASKKTVVIALLAVALTLVVGGIGAAMLTAKFDSLSKPQPYMDASKTNEIFTLAENSLQTGAAEYEKPIHDSVIIDKDGAAVAKPGLSDEQLIDRFEEFKNCEHWRFSEAQIHKEGIQCIAKSKVKYLELKYTPMDDSCMQVIGAIKNLQILEVIGCMDITPSGFQALKGNKQLWSLKLSLPEDPKKALEVINIVTTYKQLIDLKIVGKMNGPMLKKIATLEKLDSLEMDVPAEDGWKELKKMEGGILRTLKMVIAKDDHAAMRQFNQLSFAKFVIPPKTLFSPTNLIHLDLGKDGPMQAD